MKSQGEIEAAVCDGISRFQHEFLGRGPRDINAYLIGTLLVVRLKGVLSPAERQLVMPLVSVGADGDTDGAGVAVGESGGENGNGRALLKQVRAHMVSVGRQRLAEIIELAVGVKLVSVHHDISTVTGEEVFAFSLADQPACRPKKRPERGP